MLKKTARRTPLTTHFAGYVYSMSYGTYGTVHIFTYLKIDY
jgi:hypothetical protein